MATGQAQGDLPDDLQSLLPRRPKGQKLVEVEDDIVLIDETTNVVLDILEDVLADQ